MNRTDPAVLETAGDALIAEVLADYGGRVREQIEHWLPPRPGVRPYLDDLLSDYPRRAGKLLRPCICLAAARCFGAAIENALPSAVSIELLHNATLVHDDIEDDSDQRRGAPTLHAMHGVPLALNAGDALAMLGVAPLKENYFRLGPALALRVFEETERTAWFTAEGQALELGWQRDSRLDTSEEDYLHMVLLKTCWMTVIHPLRVGSMIGSRGRFDPDRLVRLGFFVGAAFQIQDDLLNLDSDPRYGKERDGDLHEGKRTLMLVHALREAAPVEHRRLTRFLCKQRSRRTRAEIQWVHDLVERTGAMTYARGVAAGLVGAAQRELEQLSSQMAPGRDLEFLRALPAWVLRRAY